MRRRLTAALVMLAATAVLTAGGSPAIAGDLGVINELQAAVASSEATVTTTVTPLTPTYSPELQKYLATLSASERTEFLRQNIPTSEEVTLTVRPMTAAETATLDLQPTLASRKCWVSRADAAKKNDVGAKVYTYYHVTRWCVLGGTRIEGADRVDYGGQPKVYGWRYEGSYRSDEGVVSNQGRAYTQHEFTFRVGPWDIQQDLPCLRVTGMPNGTATWSKKCGIY